MRKLVRLLVIAAALIIIGTSVSDAQTQSYKVAPEDIISIQVARHPEFSGEYYVPDDGRINAPSIGEIEAGGKTLAEISATAVTRLQERLRKPEVTVSLKTPHARRVYIMGSVDKPGAYDIKQGWRVTEVLAAAGGISKGIEISDCRARIERVSTGQSQMIALAEALKGDANANMAVSSGDVLTIETPETIPVYVLGKVKNPGLYRLRKDSAGLMEAVSLAGGESEDASTSRISITHTSGKSDIAGLLQSQVTKLEAGDVVTVPEETARIAVLGYVNEPGFFRVKDGQTLSLTDSLALAKGTAGKRGNIGSILIIRAEGGKQQRQKYDLHRYLSSGDASQNPVVKPGDVVYVPQVGRPDTGSFISSLATLGLLITPFAR